MRRQLSIWPGMRPVREDARRGVFLVVGALCLVGCMMFVAYSVDLGMISVTKARMQNATDTAALAAAMEITNAIANAGQNVSNVFTYAETQSRSVAATVANLNGVYIDQNIDVDFGRRYRNSSGNYVFDWNAGSNQVNCVKVTARRTGNDTSAPDGKLPNMFSAVIGKTGTAVQSESIAYIEPRDLVVVHDFSRSMNFDSYYSDETGNSLTQAQIEANLAIMWSDLQPLSIGTLGYTPQYYYEAKTNTGATSTVTFQGTSVSVTTNTKIKTVKVYFENNGGSQTFSISGESTTSGTWAGTGSNSGKRVYMVDMTIRKVGSSSQSWTLAGYTNSTANVKTRFGFSGTTPIAGASNWDDYIDFVKTNGGLALYGKKDLYGGATYICWLLREHPSHNESPSLMNTRHYPFHAIKEGHELLCDFLTDLGFDDHLGMVSYDNNHRVEDHTNTEPGVPNVNIQNDPITNDYQAIKDLMHYKQAAHYSYATNMTGGIKDAITLLDNHKREGSRPAILLMTDGNGNVLDTGESSSLPAGWSWSALFDYDGNGTADYTTSDNNAKATLKYVKQAVDKGYKVHAISVGADADRNLLKAIAFLGDGHWVDIPGGLSASNMEAELKTAFAKIAAAVPPARLVSSGN